MLSLRNRFGIPGVISVIALVFAMLGGAYAASNSSGGGKATASAKAKRGPRGPKGATGPAGPQGSAGAKGDAGAAGKDGGQGLQGSQGLPGKSVAVAKYSGPECAGSEEGATVEVAGEPLTKKIVCDGAPGVDGANGAPGAPGSPWTAGGTLPVGATETGSWELPAGPAGSTTAVSFPIPLAAELDNGHFFYVPKGGTPPAECENAAHAGTASPANPEAEPGYFCIYAAAGSIEANVAFVSHKSATEAFIGNIGASTSGAILLAAATVTGGQLGYFGGTWAVTG
jgi:hypothetical protein